MKKTILSALAAGIVLGGSTFALASDSDMRCTQAPMDKWLPHEKVVELFRKEGYEVRKVKPSGSCLEVYALKGGNRYEIYIDPVTGKPVKTEMK